MPYDPIAPTEGERSTAYYFIWTGAVGNAVLLSAQLLALPRSIIGICAVATAASLLVATLSSRNDDYFCHLTNIANRFAMGVVAIWFFVAAAVYVGDGAELVGRLAGGGEFTAERANGSVTSGFTADALAVVTTMVFHIRFLIERYRR